jgi:RNA polymerase sigma-70 factor (ECF subfamily)
MVETSMSENGTSSDPWRTCYAELAPKLLLFARQWVPTPADAEDVVQTAFVRFWKKQPDAEAAHYPLLYAAVRTIALDYLRSHERRMRRDDTFYMESGLALPTFAHNPDQAETASMVQAALECIPAEQRETLVLRIWGELTFAEIASTVGQSINTVASRYRYGMQALRKHLKPHEYERI